jgi:pimeloyl-ACP methyl ester carboxylesterase
VSQATTNAIDAPPTVVFVHGAFADGSSWAGVIERLLEEGVQVMASPNPLRGISFESVYVTSVLDQISGPVLCRRALVRRCSD